MILEQEPRKQFKLIYILLAVLFAINLFILSGCCKKGGAKMDKEIAKWIDNNPQAILESVNKFAIKQQEEAMEQERIKNAENIKKFDKELKDTKYAVSLRILFLLLYNDTYKKYDSKETDYEIHSISYWRYRTDEKETSLRQSGVGSPADGKRYAYQMLRLWSYCSDPSS